MITDKLLAQRPALAGIKKFFETLKLRREHFVHAIEDFDAKGKVVRIRSIFAYAGTKRDEGAQSIELTHPPDKVTRREVEAIGEQLPSRFDDPGIEGIGEGPILLPLDKRQALWLIVSLELSVEFDPHPQVQSLYEFLGAEIKRKGWDSKPEADR